MRSLAALVLSAALIAPASALAGFRVSSFKKDTRDATFKVSSALDSDPKSCWMVNPENENENEWIEIDVPRSTIEKLSFMSGWSLSEETHADYARLKKAKVQIWKEDDGDEIILEQEISLEDKNGWQDVELPPTKVGGDFSGGRVRITVLEVYEGKDYPALGMSEVLVKLAEKDAPLKIESEPTTSAAGHDAMEFIDDSTRTYWLSESNEGQSFAIGASDFGISALGVQSGPATYARPKVISVRQGLNTTKLTLENTDKMQWLPINPTIGFTGSAWGTLNIEVLEVYEGTKPGIAITELKLKSTNFDG